MKFVYEWKNRGLYRKNNIAKVARDVAELFRCNIDAARHGFNSQEQEKKRSFLCNSAQTQVRNLRNVQQ